MAIRVDDKYKQKPSLVNKEVDLTLAWLRGELNGTQLAKALKTTRQNVYQWIAPRLRLAFQQGKIIIP